jgi:phage tail sheath gpL-like
MPFMFNFIPGASSFRAPGTFFEAQSGGQFVSKTTTLVMGCRGTNGLTAWPNDTPRICPTIEEAATLAGFGTPLYESYRVARLNDPSGEIWISSVPVTGTAATWTLTLASLPATGGDYVIEIAVREIRGTMAAGELVATTATNLAAAINAYADPLTKAGLPVTAAAAAAVVTITARTPGAFMNELDIFSDPLNANNILGPTGRLTVVNSVLGVGAPTVAATLAALGDEIFGQIISPFGDSTSLGSASTALADSNGRWSYLAQLYGHYSSVVTGNTATLISAGAAQNDRHLSLLGRVASPTPSWEWAAGYFARQSNWLYDDANGNAARNQTGLVVAGVRPPRARADWPSVLTTQNSLINAGVCTWAVDGAGNVVINKAVTTYKRNAAGQPDIEFSNLQRMFQVMHIFRYARAKLSFKHTNKSTSAANPANVPAISTVDDVKADCVEILYDLERQGIIENAKKSAGLLEVLRDTANPSRINIGATVDGTDPLDILAAAVVFRQL